MVQIKNVLQNSTSIQKACYYKDKNGQVIRLKQNTEDVGLFYSNDTKSNAACDCGRAE